MKISIDSLRSKLLELLSTNFSQEQSEKVAEYLLWAEMSGNKTQGIVKMTGTEPLQNIVPEHEVSVLRDTKLSQLIDAGRNPAPLTAQIGIDVAIQKAKEHGFAIVGIRNTFSSNGAQAFYVEKIARENLIGTMCSRSPASAAGFGSIDPIFGTNPIGFGFPTNEQPLVFDTATSAMTFYALVLAKARGEQIPENMAIDYDGNPTTDPAAAMGGALLPFDRSYKGSGFALVVEMLAGPLVGGAWVDNKTFKEEWGTTIMAIDPELLVDIADFKANASDLLAKVKSARKANGVEEIRLPGEKGRKLYDAAFVSGFVEIDDAIARQLRIEA